MHRQSRQTSVALQGSSSCEETAFQDRYEVLRTIGRGGFAEVQVARHLLTGAEVAVKVLRKVKQNLLVLSEPNVMMSLEHPNVIQLFQVIETHEHIYMAMEYAGGGELLKHIPTGGMQEEEARRIFRQIAGAVGYCHKNGIVHQDLNAQNIMLDAQGNSKLIDFGLSMRVTAGQKLRRSWGTLAYLAPEIILHREYEGPPADVWSLGVILFYMLTGKCPFRDIFHWELARRIVEGRYHIPDSVPPLARRLIRRMLSANPMKRPTAEQILQHPWLREGEEASPHQSSEPLPKRPDPAIMAALLDLGYNPYKTWMSLTSGKFDDAAAAYLILQHQISQGAGCVFKEKPAQPRVGPHPCPTDLSDGSVLPRRSTSEPALHTFRLPNDHALLREAKHSGQKDLRRATMPLTDLRLLLARTLVLCIAPLPALASQKPKCTSRGPPKAWKPVAGRSATCFCQLCCCVPCGKKEGTPVTGEEKLDRGRIRVAPE
ncbi:Sperm motility kinase 2B [Sciurus carolinensis]|uniref:non-specific serine/threonine protein kinase n=1 Tax=Sciurus carolinensis TaxID=30640 RepID=A0AA41MNB7_SCICA|nr:Sperm motility kinase 2B [Sciurus carolinensis]